jgi:branched-subunit amino acid aminotransferase/4-amino-4-deoxychorismate lyase
MREMILFDGKPIKEGFPVRSLLYGEGLFESFRWRGKTPVFLAKHLERMKNGAEALGIPFPGMGDTKCTLENAVLDSQISDAYVKICLLSQGSSVFYGNSNGASILVVVRQYQFPDELIKAHVSSFRRNSMSPILGMKSLNYLENILARRDARALGFDEAIFLNENGEITEGSANNIFWLKEGVLFTASLECGLLSGIIRGVVIDIARELGIRIEEGRFGLDDLASSEGVFFTNSLVGAVLASQIDGFEFPFDSQVFKRIKDVLFEKLVW